MKIDLPKNELLELTVWINHYNKTLIALTGHIPVDSISVLAKLEKRPISFTKREISFIRDCIFQAFITSLKEDKLFFNPILYKIYTQFTKEEERNEIEYIGRELNITLN